LPLGYANGEIIIYLQCTLFHAILILKVMKCVCTSRNTFW
jgi:hypothetical protein